jgi:ceramide glucosyltransferase
MKNKKLPPVTVLKPLKGVDSNLEINLETFFTMDYPEFEILFCVQDFKDPAIEIVKKLMKKYPKIDAQLVLGGSFIGINPKVNNMFPGYKLAKNELILISDDKIYIQSDALLDMVDCMKDDVGMVNQIPFYCKRPGFNFYLEQMVFSAGVVKYLLFYKELTGISCNGMSSLFRKSVLDLAGGLKSVADFIVEDNEMSHIINNLGWKCTFSQQFAYQNSGNSDLSSFYSRIKRWLFVGVKYNSYLHPMIFFG